MDKVMEKWNEILQMVKEEHGLTDVSFNTWIKPLEVFAIDGNTLYILVPSEQMGLSYINKKYYLPLKVAIGEVTGIEYDINPRMSECRTPRRWSSQEVMDKLFRSDQRPCDPDGGTSGAMRARGLKIRMKKCSPEVVRLWTLMIRRICLPEIMKRQ